MIADADLFEAEMAAVSRAQATMETAGLDASEYQHALRDLIQHYNRLMRETHRLIRHGDRTEAELTAANAKLQRLGAELDYKARHDHLTSTLNRRAVFELARHYLSDTCLALILLDIDFFKQINDTFGHPKGDEVICELVERLSATLSDRFDIGRVGGEEFTILLPGMNLGDARSVADSIRQHISGRAFFCLPSHPVTASFGISWSAAGTDFGLAYSNADTALYRAKNQGRNQVAF